MSWYPVTFSTIDRRSSRFIANCKRFSRRFSLGIFRVVRRIQTSDGHLDPLITKKFQHPRSIEEIVKCTHFSKSEIRLLYRCFKQECPNGTISEDRLRSIYLQFFPQGSSAKYAHYLFSIIDRNHKGAFTFDDYIVTLSILCRGTIEEKLRWIFQFYDINDQQYITRENINEIISSLHDLLGPSAYSYIDEHSIQKHIDEIIDDMNPMHNEQITINQFIDYCKRHPQIIESIQGLSCCL